MNAIEGHTADITKLCKTHNVKSLYAFGSVLTEKFNNELFDNCSYENFDIPEINYFTELRSVLFFLNSVK